MNCGENVRLKVVVLGAGVVGVATAWYLAEAGHEVVVVDRQPEAGQGDVVRQWRTDFGRTRRAVGAPGSAAQDLQSGWDARMRRCCSDPVPAWRSGNGACAFFSNAFPEGSSATRASWQGSRSTAAIAWAALRERTGIEYQSPRRGILHFCTDEREFAALARHAEAMRQLGVEREVKSRAECIALEPALDEQRVSTSWAACTRRRTNRATPSNSRANWLAWRRRAE